MLRRWARPPARALLRAHAPALRGGLQEAGDRGGQSLDMFVLCENYVSHIGTVWVSLVHVGTGSSVLGKYCLFSR